MSAKQKKAPAAARPGVLDADSEERLHIAKLHGVEPELADDWIEYHRRHAIWRIQSTEWLYMLMTSPKLYVAKLAALYTKRHQQPPSEGWVLNHTEKVTAMRDGIMQDAKPGQSYSSYASQLLGDAGKPRDRQIFKILGEKNWLPKPPSEPSTSQRERFDRKHGITPEQRTKNADDIVRDFF